MSHEKIIDNILHSGEDDWVPLVLIVRELDMNLSGEELLQESINILRQLLSSELMTVGDVCETGFVPWRLTISEALMRIEHEWRALGHAPELGDICWLNNTSAGNQRAYGGAATS